RRNRMYPGDPRRRPPVVEAGRCRRTRNRQAGRAAESGCLRGVQVFGCSGVQGPIGRPGALTEEERFLFEVCGYVVIPGALSSSEVEACLEAAHRLHSALGLNEWRQIGAAYEKEPAMEPLIDHPSILPKARALLGDHFI